MQLQIQVRRVRYLVFQSLALNSSSLDTTSLEIRVQCTIHGELRSTGSAKRTNKATLDSFMWRQDSGKIAWYLTTKEIKTLKSKSPTLKFYVFAIGDEVYSLGWFFMDLRAPDTTSRWLKLVNSKYGGEIQVSSQLRSAPPLPPVNVSTSAITTEPTVEKKADETDCLVLGDHPVAVYILSIVIEDARNMSAMVEKLLKKCSSLELNAIVEKGFWLSYSIFDVVVQTDVFHSVDVAGFDVIRDSFRLKTNLTDLKAMLEELNVLQVFLCTIDRILCRIEVPLRSWISGEDDSAFQPLHLEGPYHFMPSSDTKDTAMGQVSVSIDLTQEYRLAESIQESKSTPIIDIAMPTHVVVEYISIQDEHPPESITIALRDHTEVRQFDTSQPTENRHCCNVGVTAVLTNEALTLTIDTDDGRVWSALILLDKTLVSFGIYDLNGNEIGYCGVTWHESLPPPAPTRSDIATFELNLNILSVKTASAVDSLLVQCEHPFYVGPRFQTKATNSIQQHQEIDLEQGEINFKRVAKSHLQIPVVLQVMHADENNAIGHAVMSLQYLLHATLQYECESCGEIASDWKAHKVHELPAYYRPFTSCDVYIPALNAITNKQVAIVHAVVKCVHPERFSDEGYRSEPAVVAPVPIANIHRLQGSVVAEEADTTEVLKASARMSMPPDMSTRCNCAVLLQKERTSFLAEKKSWELLRKKQQSAMEQNEAKRMEVLEAEWALREKERMQTVREAQQEYIALEKKLRQTLHDLDLRERALQKAEETLQHKLTLQKQEMDIVQRKTKSESQHALSLLEQQKHSSEFVRQQMEDRALRAETQLKQLEHDIAALRLEQRKSPENLLRQEIIQHQATIATLEKQMRLLQMEKDNEIQVQKELSVQVDRLTQLLHQEKRKQEEQKVQDLESLRLKYIAREERFVLDGDREELKAIKKQLDMLRQVNFSHGKEFQRLQQEKNELLATGQYTEDSYVIQELNRHIANNRP